MGWVHCHIARQPGRPDQHGKDIPAPVSAIVMKLLAKTAEERYQTAVPLTSDEDSRLEAPVPSIEVLPAPEEWRPQPRKKPLRKS